MKPPYIGFFRRALAFIIDNILTSIPPTVICLPFLYWQTKLWEQVPPGDTQQLAQLGMLVVLYSLWQLLSLITFWLYTAFCESSSWQATLGKRLLRIKVVDQQGQRLSFLHATGRTFAKVVSYATFYIGFVMAGCTKRKRALHDIIAQTYVVRRDFQTGDELPDTPSHPIWLGIWIFFLVCLAGWTFVVNSQQVAATPAVAAAARLQELAQTTPPFASPLRENGNIYFRHADGYRVAVDDGYNTTLFLPYDGTEVCCEDHPATNCRATGLPVCR